MSQQTNAADGYLGDWVQHKPKCGCTDCQLERSEARATKAEADSRQLYEALRDVLIADSFRGFFDPKYAAKLQALVTAYESRTGRDKNGVS